MQIFEFIHPYRLVTANIDAAEQRHKRRHLHISFIVWFSLFDHRQPLYQSSYAKEIHC
jgi:hypothetical protein